MRQQGGRRALAPALGALFAALGANMATAQAPARGAHDRDALAVQIVSRLTLELGEKVLLLTRRGAFDALVTPLRYAVMRAGGIDLGALEVLPEPVPAAWDPGLIVRARSASREAYRALLHDVDAAVMLPGATPAHPAPLEESVSGVVAFPPSQWSGRPVQGLRLRFERGRVTGVEAASGSEAVIAELDAGGPAARAFRELGLGFNPLLAVPEHEPWIPYYGYGAGVVRLSLGDNSEVGGAVRGDYVRWNFFADATVSVGEIVVVSSGRLVLE